MGIELKEDMTQEADTAANQAASAEGAAAHRQEGQDSAAQLKASAETKAHIREHYHKIDWGKYEAVGGNENSPIRFYAAKDNATDRLVRVLHPDSDLPVVVRIPEAVQHEELKKLVSTWEKNEHKIMLDNTTLYVVAEILVRYNQRQPLIVEGPPAVSKTFGSWVAATVIGVPYARINFSADTKEAAFLGAKSPENKRKVRLDISKFVNSKAVARITEEYTKIPEQQRSDKQRDFLLYMDLVKDFLKDGESAEEIFYAVELLQSAMPGAKLIYESQYEWKDAVPLLVFQHGGFIDLDELNRVGDTRVTDALLALLEVANNKIAINGRDEHVIRHPDAFIMATQNPDVANLPDAMESRFQKLVLPPITQEYVENILNYFMTGNGPDLRINGKVLPGQRGVMTDQRPFLENMPKRELVVKAIARFHVAVTEMVNTGAIRKTKKDGGSYVFDQRDISALLDAMIATLTRREVKEVGDKLVPIETGDISWEYVVKEAVRQVYVRCLPGDETKGDYKKVNDLLEQQPIWNALKLEQAKASGKPASGDAQRNRFTGVANGKVDDKGNFKPDF
jgi:MoxR-like ATPase